MDSTNKEAVKVDRRTRKTKKAIKMAFMDLASKNNSSKITVTEISDLADINRKTFYAYYNDVNDVIDDVENEMIDKLLDLINEYDITKFVSDPYPLLKLITNFMNEEIEFYGQSCNANVLGTFFEKIKEIIKKNLLHALSKEPSIDPNLMGYSIDYSIGGLITAYREWLNSNRKITLEELSNHLSLITADGLHSVIG